MCKMLQRFVTLKYILSMLLSKLPWLKIAFLSFLVNFIPTNLAVINFVNEQQFYVVLMHKLFSFI